MFHVKRRKENRERMNTLKSKTREVKSIRDLQKQSLEKSTDDYMVGLYNGLELSTAILENREPEFLGFVKEPEPEVVEKKEEVGRTKYSGVRKRKAGV